MNKLKVTSLFTAAALSVSIILSGCGSSDEPDAEVNDADNGTTAAEVSSDAVQAEEAAPSYEQTYDFSKTALEYVSGMKIGWNAGNSLDSVGSGLESETSWGNPKLSKLLIDSVKEAGFDTVRIPVTWMGHIGDAPDYTIDEAWLDRVSEVVDYAIENDMYTIINLHHDGNDSDQAWLQCEPSDEEAMKEKFSKLWTQIADSFESYGDHLMFAGMNEFHHGYNNPSSDYINLTDDLNQLFVDTVRATGGNNANRYLIVQSYNTNPQQAVQNLEIPNDTIENHIIAEVHFYDPWAFAGEGKGDWGRYGTETDNWGQEDWVESVCADLKERFIDDAGVPVIVGEYGATRMKDSSKADYRRYYVEYVTKTFKAYGILPIIWDNGYDGIMGEGFGLFDRVSGENIHPELTEAIMRACGGTDYEIAAPEVPEAE